VTEHELRVRIVDLRAEDEARALARVHRPSGERACDLDDVALRIAPVDAERMELEQLACVVLVQAAARPAGRRMRAGRALPSGVCAESTVLWN
jgi:hypothetical protein